MFLKALFCAGPQTHSVSFTNSAPRGAVTRAKLGKNLPRWLVMPKTLRNVLLYREALVSLQPKFSLYSVYASEMT